MKVHRVGIAKWQDEPCRLSLLGTDCTEDIGGFRALILWRGGACPPFRPSPRDLVLLPDTGLVREPNFYRCTAREGRSDLFQLGGEAPFLKASIASGS